MDSVRTSGTDATDLWTSEGTNTAADSRGNRVEVSGWEYWRFSSKGLIAESRGRFDAASYDRQIASTWEAGYVRGALHITSRRRLRFDRCLFRIVAPSAH